MTNLSELKEVFESKYCMVKCGAIWCSSCKQQDLIIKNEHIDSLLEELNIDYFYLDADNDLNGNFLDIHEIKGLPAILLFKNGECVKILKGLQVGSKLVDDLKNLVK